MSDAVLVETLGNGITQITMNRPERLNAMKSRSCQVGMPDCFDGFSERLETKNDVDMISNCQPSLRAIASALGTLGDSI